MCVIVFSPKGQRFNSERLMECAKANPDGWGMMWHDGEKLCLHKTLEPWDGQVLLPWTPGAIHFRTASIGQISLEACHPHYLTPDIAFMHNGNLFHFEHAGLTDTQTFAEYFHGRWPDFDALQDYCRRNYSKMLFMNSAGHVLIANEEAGMWEDGCWYSNGGIEHYVGYGYSGAYTYQPGDVRHKGGVLSVQGFRNAQEWARCGECGGWFFHLESALCDDCKAYQELIK